MMMIIEAALAGTAVTTTAKVTLLSHEGLKKPDRHEVAILLWTEIILKSMHAGNRSFQTLGAPILSNFILFES